MNQSYEVLRVFTRGPDGGNHLGVLMDTDGFSDSEMQLIAAEVGFSETVFIDLGTQDPHCRIFTPTIEMPFAGHPLVGATWHLHRLGYNVNRVTCQTGNVTVGSDEDEDLDRSSAHPKRCEIRIDAHRLGLRDVMSAYEVTMPLRYTVVELASAEDVSAYQPDESVLAGFSDGQHMLVYARRGDEVRSRFFAPSSGVFEDPATGSAAVALVATLVHRGERRGAVTISQGEEVGFPSIILTDWSEEMVRIGGASCATNGAHCSDAGVTPEPVDEGRPIPAARVTPPNGVLS